MRKLSHESWHLPHSACHAFYTIEERDMLPLFMFFFKTKCLFLCSVVYLHFILSCGAPVSSGREKILISLFGVALNIYGWRRCVALKRFQNKVINWFDSNKSSPGSCICILMKQIRSSHSDLQFDSGPQRLMSNTLGIIELLRSKY